MVSLCLIQSLLLVNFSVFIDVGDLLAAVWTPDQSVLVYPPLVSEHVGVFGESLAALRAPGDPLGNLGMGPPHVLLQVIELLVTSVTPPPLSHARPQHLVDHSEMLIDIRILLAAQLAQRLGFKMNHFVMRVIVCGSVG